MGDVIDGAMQQAPQAGRQSIALDLIAEGMPHQATGALHHIVRRERTRS
jgi:hypothetical protein